MDQIAELRSQVAKMQAAVQQTGPGKKSTVNSGSGTAGKSRGMGAMGRMAPSGNASTPAGGGMGMMGDKGEMGGMSAGGDNRMAAPAKAMGMCCMGEMGMPPGGSAGMSATAPPPGMAGMSGPSSAMPGQPGAAHLLHTGSTGFFLNHSEHITLTADQKATLNRLKEKAMLEQASEQRKIDQAEQALYTLTGAEPPDNSKIQSKIGEIEKLPAGRRMNIIQAVGGASNVLTYDQQQALMGTMAASKK